MTAMDPISIAAFAAGGAKTLFSIAKRLDAFNRATKTVDRSVQSLETFSQGLAGVLEKLHQALQSQVLNASENEDIWVEVSDAIKSCQVTIDELDGELEPLKEAGANYAGQAQRTFKLQRKQPEIDRLVSHMKTHSIKLQLALQTVNVIITASIPGTISADYAPRFDRLERMIGALGPLIEPAESSAKPELKRISLREIPVDGNTTRLYRSAKSIVSGSGGGTLRSSSSDALPKSQPRQYTTFIDFTPPVPVPPSAKSSEHDPPLEEGKREDIHDWLFLSPSDQTIENAHAKTVEPDGDSEGESDRDFDFDVATTSFRRGMDCYHKELFSEAREYLKLGIQKTALLSTKQTEELNLPSMQFHHGLSSIVESSLLEDAASSFRLVIEGSGSRENDAQLRCLALYQLAKVQLKLGKHAAAERYCRKAIHQMRQEESIGKGHNAHNDALYLLTMILWFKGSKTEARTVSDLLPDGQQIAEDAFDKQLALILESSGSNENLETKSSTDENSSGKAVEITFTPDISVPEESLRRNTMPTTPRAILETFRHMIDGKGEKDAAAQGRSVTPTGESDTSYSKADKQSAADQLIQTKGFRRKSGVSKGLRWAAEHGRVDVLDRLLQSPVADVDARKPGILPSVYETPLMIAAVHGQVEICESLVHSKAAIDLVWNGRTALDWAINSNHEEVCRVLLRHDAAYDCMEGQEMSPLALAAQLGHLSICQLILDKGADINEPHFENTNKKRTALMQAALRNDVLVLQWLLKRGASVNGPKPSLTTPLIEAARSNAFDACRLLLKHKADLYLRTDTGQTAARAAMSWWLADFLQKWPESRDWQPPEDFMAPEPRT